MINLTNDYNIFSVDDNWDDFLKVLDKEDIPEKDIPEEELTIFSVLDEMDYYNYAWYNDSRHW